MNNQKHDRPPVVALMLIIVGVIHLLPLAGMLGAERLFMLYGVNIADPNLEILLRHRAILFGILGVFLIYSAFRRTLQAMAITAGVISVASFLVLAMLVGDYNALVERVVIADFIALSCLAVALWRYARTSRDAPD